MERSKLKYILDSLGDGAYIVNKNCEIEYVNPVVRDEFGPVQDQKCFNYFYNRSAKCSPCSFELLEQGKPANRVKAHSKSGKSFYFLSILLNNPDGSLYKLSVLHDVTALKENEDRILQSNLELQKVTEESQKQRKFAEALVEASMIVNSSLELDDVLKRILEQVQIAIPFHRACITLFEGDVIQSGKCHLFSGMNDPSPEINDCSSLKNSPLYQTMLNSWSPILVQNTLAEPDWNGLDDLEWVRSILSVPFILKGQVIGSIILLSATPDFFTQESSERLTAFASHATIAIQNAWLFDQVRTGSLRLKKLSQHQTITIENERQYISRELHDEVGQVITSLLLDLHLLEKQVDQPETVLERAKIMENTLLNVSNDLHRVAMSLRPASLDHLGLVAAIRQHVNTLLQRQNITIKIIDRSMIKRFPKNVETMVFRIVQEALTNVIRHAHATHAEISLTSFDNKLIVTVEDDGIGFDQKEIQNPSHLGLLGMQERVQMVNGRLTIESAHNKGTKVIVEVDYDNPSSYR